MKEMKRKLSLDLLGKTICLLVWGTVICYLFSACKGINYGGKPSAQPNAGSQYNDDIGVTLRQEEPLLPPDNPEDNPEETTENSTLENGDSHTFEAILPSEDPEQAAIQFITLMTRNEHLFEENELEQLTVAALPEEDRRSITPDASQFPAYTELRRVQTELPISDHVDYLLAKQAYWSASRQKHGTTKTNFEQNYTCERVIVSGSVAQVCLHGGLTWYYTGHSQGSALEVVTEVFLYEQNGKWYVFDVFSDDGYDCTHKADLSQAGE